MNKEVPPTPPKPSILKGEERQEPKFDQKVKFLVQGTSMTPHEVRFGIRGTNLTARCSCQAGLKGQYCKHRLRILNGETKDIISGNEEDMLKVVAWLAGTDVESTLKEFVLAEEAFETAKERLSNLKKNLARALRD